MGMNITHCHACEVAAMHTWLAMLPIVMKRGCISSPPVILVTGVLSDAARIGTIVDPWGNES